MTDLTIELIDRTVCPPDWLETLEPDDKWVVRLRCDQRDGSSQPFFAYLESGGARQLAATLVRAADLADELAEISRL